MRRVAIAPEKAGLADINLHWSCVRSNASTPPAATTFSITTARTAGDYRSRAVIYGLLLPPPSPPPLSPPPPLLPGAAAGISGDPHLQGAHGDEADVTGDGVYNLLTAKNFSLNVRLQYASYRSPHSKLNVHGSW
eukprot:1827387-Prymnesium_polylepis.1